MPAVVGSAKALKWAFTLHVDAEDAEPPLWNPEVMKFLKYQLERAPRTGQLHWQGAVHFVSQCRLPQAKARMGNDRIHMEPARNWEQLLDYVWKDETSVGRRAQHGEVIRQGQRKDIEMAVELVQRGETMTAVAQAYPMTYVRAHRGLQALQAALTPATDVLDRKAVWIYGAAGTGKTRFASTSCGSCYRVLDYVHPWFDGYEGENCAVFDDVDKTCGMSYNAVKRWTDIYKMNVPVKGGSVAWQPKIVVFTSNTWMADGFQDLGDEHLVALRRRIREFVFPNQIEECAAYLGVPVPEWAAPAAAPAEDWNLLAV